ncbi:cadherin-like beta sandwich domain-containing protein, partial [Rhizobium lemnae]
MRGIKAAINEMCCNTNLAVDVTNQPRPGALFNRFPAISALLQYTLRLLMLLCLVMMGTLLSAMSAEAAASPACQNVNSDWGSGQSFTSDDPAGSLFGSNAVSGFYGALSAGERISWTFVGTGAASSANFVDYYISNDDQVEYSGGTQFSGSSSISGSHTFNSGAPKLQIELRNIGTGGGAAGASGTLTVTCTQTVATSTNANLSNISLSSGTLSPSFASGTTSYAASVANGVSTITVTP